MAICGMQIICNAGVGLHIPLALASVILPGDDMDVAGLEPTSASKTSQNLGSSTGTYGVPEVAA